MDGALEGIGSRNVGQENIGDMVSVGHETKENDDEEIKENGGGIRMLLEKKQMPGDMAGMALSLVMTLQPVLQYFM